MRLSLLCLVLLIMVIPAPVQACANSDVLSRFARVDASHGLVWLWDRRVDRQERQHLMGVLEVLVAGDRTRGSRVQRILERDGVAIIVSALDNPLEPLERRPGLPVPGCTLFVLKAQDIAPGQRGDRSVYRLARILYPGAILPTEQAWARALQRAAYDAVARGEFLRGDLDNLALGAEYFAHGLAAYLGSGVPPAPDGLAPADPSLGGRYGRAAFGTVDELVTGDPALFGLLAEFLGDAAALGLSTPGDSAPSFGAPPPPTSVRDVIP